MNATMDDDEDLDAFPDEDESTETIVCPECGAEVYEDADRCPVCGQYIIPDTRFWSGKPIWWIALGFLGLVALATALVLGL